jgi:hypothetical protein
MAARMRFPEELSFAAGIEYDSGNCCLLWKLNKRHGGRHKTISYPRTAAAEDAAQYCAAFPNSQAELRHAPKITAGIEACMFVGAQK